MRHPLSETIQIHEKDNVAVALQPVDGKEPVEPGHKIALQDIRKGDPVIKYGYPIGIATEEIPA